ncbi:MAG: ABC transporter ATP-binding protein [Bacteroidota bacterium]
MSQPVIKVENLSKLYRLGLVGTGTMVHDLNRWWQVYVRGKEDPYTRVGEVNDRSHKGSSEYVWALKDVSFSVNQGEVLGIIGRNGAGKSTLLKLLSRITSPTSGSVHLKGRVASLLEVGTGFHPELTGRENVYMNGTIMGMKRWEIDGKFDEIVEFSGVERYIDTPVKRYSSGMMVRLGFAVAAFLEPEILIVDEVLAVGDAEFQKKCLGKMEQVSKGDGRTVLFVSHNMTAVRNLCNESILLKNGSIEAYGSTEEIVEDYLRNEIILRNNAPITERTDRRGDGKLRFTDVEVLPGKGTIITGKSATIRVHFKTDPQYGVLRNVAFSISVNTLDGNHALVFFTDELGRNFDQISGDGFVDCLIEDFPLRGGNYLLNLYSTVNNIIADYIISAATVVVDDSGYYQEGRSRHPNHPVYLVRHNWQINRN